MNNEEAEEILMAAGKLPYVGYDWELVQTHLILPSGELQELWRPGHNTGGEDPEELEKALRDAVERLSVNDSSPLPSTYKVRLDDPKGGVVEVNLRFPSQENFQRLHAYTLDQIQLTADDLNSLTSFSEIPHQMPSDLAAKILIHFRPPLDDAEDPEFKARQLITKASLSIVQQSKQEDRVILGLHGVLEMRSQADFEPTTDDKWSRIIKADIVVKGFISLSADGKIQEIEMITQSASFVPPHGKEIIFKGAARLVQHSG